MKKIAYILLIGLLSSCSNSFLELYPKDSLNEGNFYKSEVEFILLANGCYIPMRNYEKNEHWVLAELISDNGSKQNNIRTGEASRGVIDQFILGSDNAAYRDFWNLSYNGITRCNKLLSELNREGVVFSKEIAPPGRRCFCAVYTSTSSGSLAGYRWLRPPSLRRKLWASSGSPKSGYTSRS
jgi:starch-binding outer membrane protein, SusD/RagB family